MGGLLVIWIGMFALAFYWTAATDAGALDVPVFDRRDYFQQPWNAYGLLPAMDYVEEYGKADDDGTIHVVGINWLCSRLELYDFRDIQLDCIDAEYNGDVGGEQWRMVVERVMDTSPLYLVLEQHRKTLEIPEVPYADPEIEWQKIAAFQRPMNGLWVTVWKATRLN